MSNDHSIFENILRLMIFDLQIYVTSFSSRFRDRKGGGRGGWLTLYMFIYLLCYYMRGVVKYVMYFRVRKYKALKV